MTVYAFDVDDTLEVSNGPVTLQSLMDLRVAGHIVGICGNWGLFLALVPGWQHLISFFNCGNFGKTHFLSELRKFTAADDFVMVGNIGPVCAEMFGVSQTGGSNDMIQAHQAAWRFIAEHDFAKGAR